MTLLAVLLLLAALWDLRKGKVPNLLILVGFILGLGRLFLGQGVNHIFAYLPGILLPPLLLFPLFYIDTLGAGDIKLFSLIGCFLPSKETFSCILISFFLGAVFSLILLLYQGRLISRMEYAINFLLDCLKNQKVSSYYLPDEEGEKMKKETTIPFAVFILISTLLGLGGISL